MRNIWVYALRGTVVLSVIVGALVIGTQLRAAREQLATGQAGSGPTATTGPLASPPATIAVTPAVKPTQSVAPTPIRTLVPTPTPIPSAARTASVSGTITAGGRPVRGAQVFVYPSNSLNHGPTPVPPDSGTAFTDDRGAYRVAVPPGTYRIGAYLDFNGTGKGTIDGFAPYTWYGDGYVIGLGKDVVVGDTASADIAMLQSVTVAGRVVGRDGAPVPQADLLLSRMVGGIQFPFGSGRTDQNGRFSLSIVAMPVTLNVQAANRGAVAWTSLDLDLRGDRTDLVLTLDRTSP